MARETRILISAAERSGDMHAANLVRELTRRRPALAFLGFGGELLARAGCELRDDLVSAASMGLGFVGHLGRHIAAVRAFDRLLVEVRPPAVILVDSPGLNFALARLARWRGVPVIYYICPQIWAWAPWRKAKVLRYTDLLLAIFPFEEELYRNATVPVRYVGHPLADELARVPLDAGDRLRERLGIPSEDRAIAVLPGSRGHEVRQLSPLLGEAIGRMDARNLRTHVLASCFREEYRATVERGLSSTPFPVHVLSDDARTIAQASDLVLLASGTASLEAAFFEKPMIVLYRLGAVARLFFRSFAVTPYFTLPNILGARLFDGEPVVLERICGGGEAEEIAREGSSLLAEGPAREEAIARLRTLKESFFSPGATARAADAVLQLLDGGL